MHRWFRYGLLNHRAGGRFSFEEGDLIFGPAVLVHKLTGEGLYSLGVAVKKIIIIALHYFRVNAEVIVFGNKKVLDFEFRKSVLDI